ncbi:DUF5076 domain-containing protein [Salinarimonas ramus]|uniref:DUF5076 domain-containing protein n=1 Tax=Salinarimonas ramus TaxID=690164 RepID=A0A917V1T0_9HYPH|nr:DUF5076 domain-containing protein [Salinarimonas ramus]GGK18158.1 DUF5076 domain-containing protein [Salinarimonas ramus]
MADEDDTRLFHELEAPPDALEKGGHEVLRASVVEGGVSVTLRRSFDDPFTWGLLLVDLARHAARIYALEAGMSEEEAMAAIRAGIEAELDRPTDPGTTGAVN